MSKINWPLVQAVVVMSVLLLYLYSAKIAFPQEHRHPAQDMPMHEKFYSTWTMPDNRSISCCHNEDCAPAESRIENGHWVARKVGDTGGFTSIPANKVENDRDSPDGRSHLCGRRTGGELSVFCFLPAAGG